VNVFDVGTPNDKQELSLTTLPAYTTSAIKTVDNLLDLQVEDYDHMQNYLSSNATINYQNVLNPNSSNHVDSLDKSSNEDFLGLSSDSDILSLPFEATDLFYSSIADNSTKVQQEIMNNSDEKVRLRITSPTLDESEDFSSLTRNFGERNKSPRAQSNPRIGNQLGPQRLDREDSPTDSMTDSAIGESTVTSPIIGHLGNNICDDAVQMLSPDRDRGAMSDQLGQSKSQCSSFGSDREENFESYGENDDAGIDADDNMESPNFPYMIEGSDRDVVDRAGRPSGKENNLRSIESASNFHRTSPQRNSIRTKAWMRSSLRKGQLG